MHVYVLRLHNIASTLEFPMLFDAPFSYNLRWANILFLLYFSIVDPKWMKHLALLVCAWKLGVICVIRIWFAIRKSKGFQIRNGDFRPNKAILEIAKLHSVTEILFSLGENRIEKSFYPISTKHIEIKLLCISLHVFAFYTLHNMFISNRHTD